ncbi:MAG: hypothetical protein JRJ60_10585 [Deltaproteobacteria bacterium]|nr:hypothetical protein [Deltaproteobacteria bacterium]
MTIPTKRPAAIPAAAGAAAALVFQTPSFSPMPSKIPSRVPASGIAIKATAFLINTLALRYTDTRSPDDAPALLTASMKMLELSVAQWHTFASGAPGIPDSPGWI